MAARLRSASEVGRRGPPLGLRAFSSARTFFDSACQPGWARPVTLGMSASKRRITAIFNVLRRDIPDDVRSDLELLQAAKRLAHIIAPIRCRQRNERRLDYDTLLDMCWAVDYRIASGRLDLVDSLDMGYRVDSDLEDMRLDSSYGPFSRFLEY
jgi:hypothetical protein